MLDEELEPAPPAGTGRRRMDGQVAADRGRRRLRRWRSICALLALQQRSQLQQQRSQTRDLEQVSGQLVGALTTYDYQHLADWQKAVLAHATGSFRNGFNDRFSSRLAAADRHPQPGDQHGAGHLRG